MAHTLLVLEAMNLICGDTGNEAQPGYSTHLQIQEVKLPGFEKNMMDHNAGGARVGIEVSSHINKMEMTFNLAGWNKDVQGMIGRSLRSQQRFTAYGLLRDRRTGKPLQCRAHVEGELSRVNPTNFQKGTLQGHEYRIGAIIHYELYMQTGAALVGADSSLEEVYYWDFFENSLRVNAEDINREHNLILAIPGSAI